MSALQQLNLAHSLSDGTAGQLLVNWPSCPQRSVPISLALFLFWVSVTEFPHTCDSSIDMCETQIYHSKNIAGSQRSAKGSPGCDLFWGDRRPGPSLLMIEKKSHEVVYIQDRMSSGVQVKKVKSHSPSEMRICILTVMHRQVTLGEAADRLTAAGGASVLP